MLLTDAMKQTKQVRSKLHLETETVRTLKLVSPEELGDVRGGQGGKTRFSCGNICISINAC